MARNLLQGTLWTVPFIAFAVWLPKDRALIFLAMLLTFVAGVYLGFALPDKRRARLATEALGIVVTGSLAVAGLWADSVYLAAGYGFHALWDFLHHPGPIRTHTPRWYAHACTGFDLVVGGFILYWWR